MDNPDLEEALAKVREANKPRPITLEDLRREYIFRQPYEKREMKAKEWDAAVREYVESLGLTN